MLARTSIKSVICQQTPFTNFLVADTDYQKSTLHREFIRLVAKWIYRRASRVVATSQGVAEDLQAALQLPSTSVEVIPNSIDLTIVCAGKAEPISDDTWRSSANPIIVAVGRLAYAKNYPLLIAALRSLRQDMAFEARIFGTGELEAPLRELIAEAELEGTVRLCGFQDNPWKYVAASDVFVLTSHYEGFGNVLIEAMACGTPVIATRSAGTEAIVRDGENGILVMEHEATAVADAIRKVLSSPILSARLAKNGLHASTRYASKTIALEYSRLIESMIKSLRS